MRLLLCPPDFYGIRYEINPWMNVRHGADQPKAAEQWRTLVAILGGPGGAEVERISPAPALPDLVFTANAGLLFQGTFILSNFRYPERQKEAPIFEAWFKERGHRIARLAPELCFEGEGDALFLGSDLLAGYHFRSDIRAHEEIARILGVRVVSLELADGRFYHLDTCFCPIGGRAALYFPPAFDPYARRVLDRTLEDAIEAPEEEALRFCCNAVVLGRRVVMNSGCPKVRAELEARGYTVHETELSEFLKAGGAAKCLTLYLD